MQLHDLSHEDLPDGSVEFALRALSEFDWGSEVWKEKQALEAREETCPAGMGFVSDDHRILHIIPLGNGKSCYHYHFPVTTKLFGFIPSIQQKTISVRDLDDEYRAAIIQNHYDGKHEQLQEMLQSRGTEWKENSEP